MAKNTKKSLYESIMKEVSKVLKNSLDEYTIPQYQTMKDKALQQNRRELADYMDKRMDRLEADAYEKNTFTGDSEKMLDAIERQAKMRFDNNYIYCIVDTDEYECEITDEYFDWDECEHISIEEGAHGEYKKDVALVGVKWNKNKNPYGTHTDILYVNEDEYEVNSTDVLDVFPRDLATVYDFLKSMPKEEYVEPADDEDDEEFEY